MSRPRPSASGGLRGVTHDDLWSMQRIDGPSLSPDQRHVAFMLCDPEVTGGWVELRLIDPAMAGPARCLLAGPEPKAGIAWSPDSAHIAFVMRPAGEPMTQLYVIDIANGALRRLTELPNGVSAPRWRPDGRALLFESACESAATRRRLAESTPRAYETTPVRWWNRWLDTLRPHPFVIDLHSPAHCRDLMRDTAFAASTGFRGVFVTSPQATVETLQARWSPDGSSIVFAAHPDADELVRSRTGPAIFSMSAGGGEPTRITPAGRTFTDPMYSRDGAMLLALERHWPDGYSQTDLVRLDAPGSAPESLTPTWDRSVTSFFVGADDTHVYVNAEDEGTPRVFRVARGGGQVKAVSDVSVGAVRAFAALPNRVLALHETTTRAPEIIGLPVESGDVERLTALNDARAASFDAPPPRHLWFRCARGDDIHSLLFVPPHFDPTRKYPLVVCIHGGPHVMAADTFHENWLNPHLLARPGHVVLCPNYSGSTGFGRDFAESVESDVLRRPAAEILEAVDAAAREFGFIDVTRQAAVGGSYGGYLVYWLLGRTRQFKCAVVHAGAVSNPAQYGASDCGFDRECRMQGPVWGMEGQWCEQNPIGGAAHWQTPTLITQGETDYRVPVTESLTAFKLLQRRRVPSRLLVFPDEGHFIAKRANSRVLWAEIWRWLRHHLREDGAQGRQ